MKQSREKAKRKRKRRAFLPMLLAGAVSITSILPGASMQTVKAAELENTEVSASGRSIAANAGNPEMKTYGQSLEKGENATVKQDSVPQGSEQSYYVDSAAGSDDNAGTSENAAWKTFAKVNSMTFQPGDRILLKAGGEWNTTLSPKGSGQKDKPIILSAYGTGNLPKLAGKAAVEDVIYLENQEYWDISNLEISNHADGFSGTQGELLKDLRGIRIAAKPGQTEAALSGYNLHHLYVHDVSGEVKWIGGSGTVSPGVTKGGGWDGSKRTGGIIFEVLAPDTGTQPTIFSDITIEKNVINNNSFGGIIIKQWKGDLRGTNELWANRESGNHWTPHKNIVIQDNYLSQQASNFACNTIYLTSIDGAMVQRNVSREAGTCGIEMYYTDDTVIQYNEVYDTRVKAGGADSNAIDPDKCATNALIQYNYVHDTGDGILLCGFVEGSSVVRYNVIQDAEKRYLNPHGDKGNNYIYNNIFYNSKGGADFVKTSGDDRYYNGKGKYYLYNNIFYNASGEGTINLVGGSSIQFDNNCYYGTNVNPPSNEKNGFLKDPEFADSDIGGAREDINVLANLKLKETSPILGMAREVSLEGMTVNVGNTDFFGNELNQPASVGIAEYSGGKAVVKGYVTDEFGNKVAGAQVLLAGQNTETTTDENGYYQFTGLETGSYQATVKKTEYYKDGTTQFTATAGKVTLQELKAGECTVTTGAVSGTVTCEGQAVADAKVTLTGTGTNQTSETNLTVQTDAQGKYSISDIPVGKAYTVTVTRKGYDRKAVKDIEVKIMGNTVADIALAKEITTPVYSINEDFSSYGIGSFSENELWGITDPGEKGTVMIEEENGNKYLHLNKTDKSAVAALYNKLPLGLGGTLTIEARVKRTQSSSGTDQYGLSSFNSADWTKANPSGSKNPMATFAMTKGKIITHNVRGASTTVDVQDYTAGQWYIIRNVVDLNNGTFDFYVDDMQTPKLTDQPLRTAKDTLDYVNLFSSSNNSGDLCVDYIRVCKGISYGYGDTGLNGLTADGVEITKAADGTFQAEAPAEMEQIALAPIPSSGFAGVSIQGTPWDKKNPVAVQLKEGENSIVVTVTAESGDTKEYQLTVNRKELAAVGYLKSLSIDEVALSPEFKKDTEEYAAKTSLDRICLNCEKAAEESKVEVTVNGSKTENLQEIALKEGANTISVYVESADGADHFTYTIQIDYKAVEKMPDAYGDVVFSENFDGNVSEHFSFDKGSAIENGRLVLNGRQGEAAVSKFAESVLGKEAVDFSFDWSSAASNKAGVEFRDMDGKLIFALCAGKTDLRPSVTGGAAAGGETVEPTWTLNQVTWTAGKVYRIRVRADFKNQKVSYRISEKGGQVLYQQLEAPMEAANLARMNIGVWYAPKTQYIDNFVLTAPGAETPAVVNKEVLRKLYEESQGKVKSDYTEDSWAAFAEALATAKSVLDKAEAAQKEVDDALTALQAANEALVESGEPEPGTIDKPALNTAITEASALKESEYTPESWKAFQEKLKEAQEIAAKEGATPEEITKAFQELETAKKALKKNSSGGNDNTGGNGGNGSTGGNGGSTGDNGGNGSTGDNGGNGSTGDNGNTGDNGSVGNGGSAGGSGNTGDNGDNTEDNDGVEDNGQTPALAKKVAKIKFETSKYQIAAGRKVNLGKAVTTLPKNAENKTLTWKSSNKKYVSVSGSGMVTAKKAGIGKKVTITATAKDGSGVKGKVTVQVMKHAVKRVSLKAKTKTLKAGKKLKITAQVRTSGRKANKKLAWKTSNKKYAVVNSKGVVTAKKAGRGKTVTITATSTDGTNKKGTIKIKIKK